MLARWSAGCSLERWRSAVTRAGGRRLAILAFHKIGDPPAGWRSWFYVPERGFVGFLKELRIGGWRVIDVTALLCGLSHPESLPDRSALITFDDGSRSVLRVALPRLREFGYPAVVFMPTDFLGRRNTFDAGVEPDEPICDLDDLRELELGGVSIQSHAASHRRLSELTPAERLDELVRSKAVLEQGMSRAVEVLAYPYGDDGGDAHAARSAGYRAACLYGGGPIRLPPADCYHLERLAMGPDTDLRAALTDAR